MCVCVLCICLSSLFVIIMLSSFLINQAIYGTHKRIYKRILSPLFFPHQFNQFFLFLLILIFVYGIIIFLESKYYLYDIQGEFMENLICSYYSY